MTESNGANAGSINDDRPTRIGPYKILDVLGEGGMSVVYLADQTEPVKRQVALKIIKLGMDSKQVVARFESERQALAVLDHPNIAKIFDGGIAESGRSYFVMERVHGIPITDYCDNHRLDTNARIRIFIDVCSAVQHAHHKGLIHRDLKPSNILVGVVDAKPQVKIIDFGIAKATSQSFTDKTLFTKIGQLVGTPQYMSPEQADVTGLDVDTRTDIYSLGVVFYELLVGTLPLDLTGVAEQAIKVALQEREPPRPSTRVTELGDTKDEIAKARNTNWVELRRQLTGDLDWIVMRAMAKDRTRRYETANALAAECRRVLKHEPVLARPPSAGYLLQRFVRRNRTIVVAGAFALLAILAGATAATIGFVRATQAEQAALREAETARQVSDFLVELFEVSDPSEARGNSILAREILDRGADRVREGLSSEPQVQSALMNTMGNVYSSLGLYESAQPLLDDALQKNETEYGRRSVKVASSLFNLGELARLRGEYSRSEALHREALSIREDLLSETDLIIASSMEGLGLAQYYESKYGEAEIALLRALEMYVDQLGEDDWRVAGVASNLARVMHNTDRYDEAERLIRRSLRIQRQNFGSDHPLVASNLMTLALILDDTGRLEEAIETFDESLRIYRKIYPGDHPFTAETQAHLAILIRWSGDLKKSEEYYLDSIGMLERTVGREHMLTARVKDSYGQLLFASKRFEEAEPILAESVELHRTLLGDRHINTARVLNNMGALLFLMGDYDRAEPFFRESLSIRAERFGDENVDLANSKNNLADLLNRIGKYEEAERLAIEAADSYGRVFSPSHWRAAVARNILGASLAGLGRYAEAETLILESNAIIGEARAGSIYHRLALQRTIDFYAASSKPEQEQYYREQLNCVEDSTDC